MADDASDKSDAIADMARECDKKSMLPEVKTWNWKGKWRDTTKHQNAIAQVDSCKDDGRK